MILRFRSIIFAVFLGTLWTSAAFAEPATGWVVTNWAFGDPTTLTVMDAETNSPSVTPATGVSLLAGYPSVTLNHGDVIQGSGSMTITGADGFLLAIQFRIGLFREADSGPNTGDGVGYTGFTIENDGLLKETSGASNPFSSGGAVPIAPGIDPEGDMLNAQNFTASFSLAIRRVGDNLDFEGLITDGNLYNEHFAFSGYPPGNLDFSFNRIGFLVGNTARADTAFLSNVEVMHVRAVPEPAAALMVVLALLPVWRTRWHPTRGSREISPNRGPHPRISAISQGDDTPVWV